MRSLATLSVLALLVAACEVNVVDGRGANAPPPSNGGAVSGGGASAPPAYQNGTPPPAYGGGTTAPPATAVPPATGAPPTAPPPSRVANPGLRGINSGVGLPWAAPGTPATGAMSGSSALPGAPPKDAGSRGTDMATPIGRLPLVSGDVDFGTNVQYSDSFRGMVYALPPGTTSMPNFDALRPQFALYTRTFEVEPQNFTGLGVAGASPRTQDFGIRYEGFFNAKKQGAYRITLANEDGARVYIDNKLVVDNDGLHVVTWKAGNVDLTAGTHLLRVEYFKAASNREVALMVFVQTPDMAANGVAAVLSPEQ